MGYTGTAYIGVVGPESDIGICRDSIHNIARRPGDALPLWVRATKGFEARQTHINKFIESKHDFLLLLDHDMVFPDGTLEYLRAHELPYVSGLYMRRQYQPIAPVWFKPWRKSFPLEPWIDPVEKGKLHKLGASGWGCILIHREVILETRKVLKGEADVLEDDMDLWPYDLERLFGAVNGIIELDREQPPARTLRAALSKHVEVLREELRPLRGIKTNVGSDIRYPFYALQAGYQLWGDPDIECGHITEYPISPMDWADYPAEVIDKMRKQTRKKVREERQQVASAVEGMTL